MITPDNIREALARCAAYDPAHFPKSSTTIAEMWFEHFAQWTALTHDELRRAVREYYNRPSQPVPQPADISVIARKLHREDFERSELDSPERRDREAICDSKAQETLALAPTQVLPMRAIESFAGKFGISTAEARVRMGRGQGTRNELDARRIEYQHRRLSAPPQPVPCPDCGSTAFPCPCEEDGNVGQLPS